MSNCRSCGLPYTEEAEDRVCVCGVILPVYTVNGEDYWDFCVEYAHDGKSFGLLIRATSFEDAEARIRAIGESGTVDGKLAETIPADEAHIEGEDWKL